jgi:hypothetical protein
MPPPQARPSPVVWLRHHPGDWRQGTLDVPALTAAANELTAHHGFDQSVRHFATCWQQAYDADPVLTAVMRNNLRYVQLLACLWLDHVRDPQAPHLSVTPGRICLLYTSDAADDM